MKPTGQLHRTPVAVSLHVLSQPPLLTAQVSAQKDRDKQRRAEADINACRLAAGARTRTETLKMMLDERHAQCDRRRDRTHCPTQSGPSLQHNPPNHETNEEERLSPKVCPVSGYEIKNLVILDEKS